MNLHLLPWIDDILNDCAKGKIWKTIDMTNSFFQMPMEPADIPLMAVSTHFGLFKWMVMLMGLKNTPVIHQHQVTAALCKWIGKICHIYLDDIVIWSDTLEEHHENVCIILMALREASLYCSPQKTHLSQLEIDFLGHHVLAQGIEANSKKTGHISQWPQPHSAKAVHQFLGLV